MSNNYKKYLTSQDWSIKRNTKLNRKSKTKKNCAICGSKEELNIHHLNYKNLVDVEQSDLRILCHNCHKITHQLFNTGKIKFKSTNHHSRFATIKNAVKAYLGLSKQNLFKNIMKNFKSTNETNNKEILKRYRAKPNMQESTPDNIICGYCGKTKKQVGRYYFCPSCRNIKLPSGKPAGKFSL